MSDEISETYEKEEMNEFIEKIRNLTFDELVKSKHFLYSVDQKNTDLDMLKRNFGDIDKIKLVGKRKHKNGKISCDFYYELEDKSYIVYSLAFEERPVLINGFHVRRNFESFRKALARAYKDKLIGN
jgi:hypothetical protein